MARGMGGVRVRPWSAGAVSRLTEHPVSLEEFAIDPQLGAFVEASPGQRLVFRLLDGLPPAGAEQRELAEEMLGRTWSGELEEARRIAALIMGADAGKSVMASQLLVHRSLFAPLDGLRPGQLAWALLVGPDMRLASIPLDYAKGTVTTSDLIREELLVDPTPSAQTIRFQRGTVIGILPATSGGSAVRGRRFVAVVLEECAFFRDSDYRVNDVEIVRALRPRLLRGAQLLGISTPYRKSGWLWKLHREEFGRSRHALVLKAPTKLMRPDKAQADLDRQYEEDPTAAAAELGAEFLDNAEGLLDISDLEACVDGGVARLAPDPRYKYAAAMDPSGLRNDPWAFTIVGRPMGEGPVLQFIAKAWRPGAKVADIVGEIGTLLREFGLSRVFTDQYGSEVTREHFTRAGIVVDERPFTAGASSPKTLGFKALKELVVAQRIRLLDVPEQTRELGALEVTRLSGGGERIAAPGRLHDDRACALALAVGESATPAAHHGLGAWALARIARQEGVPLEEAAQRYQSRTASRRLRAWEASIAVRTPKGEDARRLSGDVAGPKTPTVLDVVADLLVRE